MVKNKTRNSLAREVRTSIYRQRVINNKLKYNRKKETKHGKNESYLSK